VLGLLGYGDIEKTLLNFFPAAKTLLPLGIVMYAIWLIKHERGPILQDSASTVETHLRDQTIKY
jgi:hypothetical protein